MKKTTKKATKPAATKTLVVKKLTYSQVEGGWYEAEEPCVYGIRDNAGAYVPANKRKYNFDISHTKQDKTLLEGKSLQECIDWIEKKTGKSVSIDMEC